MFSGIKTHTFVRHGLNVFYLKDFVTWRVCEMLSDISLGGVFTLLLQLPHWAPCSLTDSQIHGLIKTGRFFRKPTSWAPCRRLQSRIMAKGKIPVSWAPCSDLFYKKESLTWCLYQDKVRFFIVTVFFDVRKQCLFQEQ